ncbi:MAG: Sjogren's syndrome/scleroderma autoantigen 1 family protein [Halobacteriales archaeon]|nr:Sjogren's syndrome/scleroderma autoantigen 1 family protein [Halobacteriales archaeon]
MSEEFDKEAEREKLRQQLAAEEESRQATQHMSELLLKGATMTNRHCDDCGDPLFRHEGREFCPTCGTQGAGGGEAASEAADATAASGDSGTATAPPEGAQSGSQPADPSTPSTEPVSRSEPAAPQQAGAADLPAAREALARKVTALAQEAEATSDVGRARELLAAVREGAEALRALGGQR